MVACYTPQQTSSRILRGGEIYILAAVHAPNADDANDGDDDDDTLL